MEMKSCDHEKVCTLHIGSLAWKDDTPCMANYEGCKECTHDTRRIIPAPQQPNLHTCEWKEIRNGVGFCHFNDKPTTKPPASPALAKLEARQTELQTMYEVIQNTKGRYEDNDNGTVDEALDDVRYHVEGSLIEIQEKIATLRQHTPASATVPERNCEACIQGYSEPCDNPIEGCPYYEPGCLVPKLNNGEPNCPDECAFSEQQKAHDAQVAKAARERVLKEALEKFSVAFGYPTAKGNPEDSFIPTLEPSEVAIILESLRTQQEGRLR